MGRFHGRFDYSIDAKGRVNMPAKFRKGLNPGAEETFIICRAPGGCLRAYPKDLWEEIDAEMASWPETAETLRLKRQIYNTISESTLDAQGRISLTQAQMNIAGITRDATLVGQAKYIEIWDTARFTEYLGADTDDGFDETFFSSVNSRLVK